MQPNNRQRPRRVVSSPFRSSGASKALAVRAQAAQAAAPATPAVLAPNVIGNASRFNPRQLSVLLDRLGFANLAGLTFEGDRNLYAQLGYAASLKPAHYRNAYERGGIAKRIVDAYPLSTWSADIRITEDQDSQEDTPFELAIRDLFSRLDVWSRLIRADILANIGRYAVLVIGAAGKLDTPLPKKLNTIHYLTPLGEDNAKISEWDEDTSSPRYGQPLVYSCRLSGAPTATLLSTARKNVQTDIHYTRIVHIAEGLLEDDVFGTPRLRAVWNYLDDLMKIVGGGAEAAWKRMDPGLHLDVDPELDVDDADLDDVSDQVDDYQHGLRRTIQTRGTKLSVLAATVAAFASNATAVLELISGTSGIPQRILLGSERGQLASGQDRDNWDDRRRERRRVFAAPLVHQLVDRLIEHGALPTPVLSASRRIAAGRKYAYDIMWPEVVAFDNPGTAEILSKIAAANQQQSQANGGLFVTADEVRHYVLNLGPRPKEAEVPGPNANAATNADTAAATTTDTGVGAPDAGTAGDTNPANSKPPVKKAAQAEYLPPSAPPSASRVVRAPARAARSSSSKGGRK